MQFIGTVYGGGSVTQVALNYLRAKGTMCLQLHRQTEQVNNVNNSAGF